MIGMALTRTSLTVQLTSGIDIFMHVCRQKVDTSSNCCNNSHFSYCQMSHDLQIVFWEITTDSNF